MPKRAIVYARVSTDEQRKRGGIPSQVVECHEYAQENGYVVVGDQFVDHKKGLPCGPGKGLAAYADDYTGTRFDRPALSAALDFLRDVGADVMIVYDPDRLARPDHDDNSVFATLEKELASIDVDIEYVTVDFRNENYGWLLKPLLRQGSKQQIKKMVDQFNRGKKHKAKEMHQFVGVGGRVPYGYRLDATKLGGLAVDKREARTVRRIFDLYASGNQSLSGIARTLTEAHVPNFSGKTRWSVA